MTSRKLAAAPGALAVIAAALAAWFLVSPIGQAAAGTVAQEQAAEAWEASLQRLEVSEHAAPQVIERDAYSVALVTVVQWPVPSRDYSDGFGWRVSPTAGASSDHRGVDFTPGAGTEILPIAAGTVTQAGWNGGLGQAVTIEHDIDGQRVTSVYGHMVEGSIRVEPGQQVTRESVLGLVGSTGISTGPHLHFEVIIGGQHVDPLAWLHEHANAHRWE